MSDVSQSVDDILEGIRQPQWRVPLDMLQSKKLAEELASWRRVAERLESEKLVVESDRDALRARLAEAMGLLRERRSYDNGTGKEFYQWLARWKGRVDSVLARSPETVKGNSDGN